MAKLTKTNVFKAYDSKPETPMDKTTRVVKKWSKKTRKNDKLKLSGFAMLALKEKRR